ncbi:MAG TPA: sigma-70 family RNA polymerase sigma factor [Thermomicrobiales bacterium]|nr:sigma-70 family RNA polymerase sigma factor [Thermomicrobiales bacterium]
MQATWREPLAATTEPSEPTGDAPDTELELIRTATGHPEAFAPLYRIYAPAIYRFCYRRLGHPENAADATSQVFIKAIAGLKSFRPDPNNPGKTFRAWLYRIAHNVVVDAHRKHRPHQSLDAPGEVAALVTRLRDPARSPEEIAIAAADARAIRATLTRLPDRQREIVELRLAELTGEEIAEALGMSLSAVKSAQFRAFGTLRAALCPPLEETDTSR